jgi:hypothetical protein
MTAAEHHQQQLEEQQLDSQRFHMRAAMACNHGKFVAVARLIRDNPEDSYVKFAVKYLLEALEEHDKLEKEEKALWQQ